MKNQDTLRNLLLAGAVFVFIMAIGPALLPPPPKPPVESAAVPSESPADAPAVLPASKPETATAPTEKASVYVAVEDDAERTFELGAALADGASDRGGRDDPFRTKLVLSNVGASIDTALLSDHAATVRSHERYRLLAPLSRADGKTFRSLGIDKINIDGVDVELAGKKWRTAGVRDDSWGGETGQSIAFELDLRKDDVPSLRLTRTWRLPKQTEKSGRHDLHSEISIANLTDQPRRVIVTYHGGLGLHQDRAAEDRVVDYALRDPQGRIAGTRVTNLTAHQSAQAKVMFALTPSEPDKRLSWAATGNTYFTCTVAPLASDGKSTANDLAEASLIDADADLITTDDATIRFITTSAAVPAGGTTSFPAAIYLGEKDGHAFRAQPDYAERNYYFQISAGFGWCTFGFLVEVMIWLLNTLFFLVRDFGVAIIILVLLVRAMLHPLTKKGQINMVRMQHKMSELAPKIEELKKKFGNDKARLNQEMMKLNINPAGQLLTCLPMFIQMPIWVALFLSLSNNILMRHEPLHLTWIHDLTAPDALIPFSQAFVIPLVGWHLNGFNLLPILVSVFMYLQQKTAPKPPQNPNMSEEQRQQQEMMQKMMPMMSIMMLFIFYNMPAGLNLYIMFSSLFGWIEQVHIRRHIKQREAEGTLHKTPTKPGPTFGDDDRKPGKPSFLEKLQKMAEEAQKNQMSKKAPKPRR